MNFQGISFSYQKPENNFVSNVSFSTTKRHVYPTSSVLLVPKSVVMVPQIRDNKYKE